MAAESGNRSARSAKMQSYDIDHRYVSCNSLTLCIESSLLRVASCASLSPSHSHPLTSAKLLGRTDMDLCRPRAGAAALLLARPRTAVKQHSTPVHSAAVSSTPECRTHAQLSPRARCCCNYPIRGQDAKLTPAEPPIARQRRLRASHVDACR